MKMLPFSFIQEVDYKGSYGPGQTIYGRVLWHPSQDLHFAYKLFIQQVFLCTGAEGLVYTYIESLCIGIHKYKV